VHSLVARRPLCLVTRRFVRGKFAEVARRGSARECLAVVGAHGRTIVHLLCAEIELEENKMHEFPKIQKRVVPTDVAFANSLTCGLKVC
jgi:hypothetical protein